MEELISASGINKQGIVREEVIDRLIHLFNREIKESVRHNGKIKSVSLNTSLNNISVLNGAEIIHMEKIALEKGFVFNSMEDNYQTMTYSLTIL